MASDPSRQCLKTGHLGLQQQRNYRSPSREATPLYQTGLRPAIEFAQQPHHLLVVFGVYIQRTG
jgi:hypothetical protein